MSEWPMHGAIYEECPTCGGAGTIPVIGGMGICPSCDAQGYVLHDCGEQGCDRIKP